VITQRLKRTVVATTMGLAVAAGGLATASTAQAYDTGHTKVSCSAVKIRKAPSKHATVGIGYRGDKVAYNQWAYKRAERQWYTRGTVTRKSDGKKVYGYMVYQCANPYGTNPAPTPNIPK
jgi:nickel-dependent lactate racemase